MSIRYTVAIDLGASSGRVMLASFDKAHQQLSLTEVHRFTNRFMMNEGHTCWDLDLLEQHIRTGLSLIEQQNIVISSIGIDTWGVDYVLLNAQGERVGLSYSYRDKRTENVMQQVQKDLKTEWIYQQTGIQFLPFNTLYQLKAMQLEAPSWRENVAHFVMIPDYLAYRLTGKLNCEYTNATTSQLVDVKTGDWNKALLDYLQIPHHWFMPIKQPGNTIGYWQNSKNEAIPVISVASHDTASAVIATPLKDQQCAYLSSGTWSLMGIERSTPCVSTQSLYANITNEGGAEGRYRVLKNIMGLWLFQSICKEHHITDIAALINDVEHITPFTYLINPNDKCFLNPDSMSKAIQDYCQQQGKISPSTPAQLSRCIFDSLALLYRYVFLELQTLHCTQLTQLHIVGGGSQNALLNQLCANTCGIPVITGPIEASTLGNVGLQLIALNEIEDIDHFRHLISNSTTHTTFMPKAPPSENVWQSFLQLIETKR